MIFFYSNETFLTGSLKRHKIINEHSHLSKHENELFLEFILKKTNFKIRLKIYITVKVNAFYGTYNCSLKKTNYLSS